MTNEEISDMEIAAYSIGYKQASEEWRTANASLAEKVKYLEGAENELVALVNAAHERERALLAQIEKMREAFGLEEDKADKARDFILNQECSCTGGGVGTPGGCDRCRALDYLSTFGWDFKESALAKLGGA